MPFLDGRPWHPTGPLNGKSFSTDCSLFRVSHTGEVFESYDQYIERLRLLQSHRWTSLKGTSGLNFSQASMEDSQRKSFLLKEAAEKVEMVVRRAHHSVLPLARLVQEIQVVEGSPSSDKENINLQTKDPCAKPTTASAEEIRAILHEATQVEQHGDTQVWLAKPEYREKFSLAKQIPDHLIADPSSAALTAQPNGISHPKESSLKGVQKRKKEAEPAVASKKAKTSGRSSDMDVQNEGGPPPPCCTLEEEEAKLTDGTHKAAIFRVLKEAGSAGFTLAQIVETAQRLGLKDYTDKSRKHIGSVIMSDSSFVRVSKSTYAIRALMGDKPYEATGGRSVKTKKSLDSVPADPNAASGQQTSLDARPVMNGHARAKSPSRVPPLLTVEEEESKMKPGTNKEAIFKVLKEAGHEGFSLQQIVDTARTRGLKDFKDTQKNMIVTVLISSPTFVRVSKGVYALRALMGDRPYEALGEKPTRVKEPKIAGVDAKGAPASQTDNVPPGDEPVESKTKNEIIEMEVRKTLEAHRKALERALASEQKAEQRIKVATESAPKTSSPLPKTPAKVSAVEALGQQPALEVSAEEAEFRGDVSNAEDVRKHETRLKELRERLKEERDVWEVKLAEARKADEQASKVTELVKAQRALKSAKKRVADNQASLQTASQALQDAVKAVQREKTKKAAEEKKAEDKRNLEETRAREKKAREQARQAEKDRKKAEALEQKKYPMEDLLLLEELQKRAADSGEAQPAADLPLPETWMSVEDSEATSGLVFVADFLSQFSKVLKISELPQYDTLLALLEPTDAKGRESQVESLAEVYERLLEVLLQESEEGSEEETWLGLLDAGTLSDILRRYLLSEKETNSSLFASKVVSSALDILLQEGIEGLSGHQHQVLLTFLCDDILGCEKLRDALQDRIDGSGDVRREMREAVAEKKGELKELLDAEKEARKQERNEIRAAKKAKQEALKQQKEQKAVEPEAEGVPFNLEEATPVVNEDAKETNPEGPNASVDEDEEEEPSWELPPELQEYLGDSSDRKGLLTWRQKQQSARQKLEKAKEKWHASAKERAKKREAERKAKLYEEQAKDRAKAAAEEEVIRQQEAFEKELEKFSIRRVPLGTDRHHRRYWWGLAGQRAAIYIEKPEGEWTVLSSVSELDTLMTALEKRGIRELALHAALEKVYPSVAQAMKKASAGAKQKPGLDTVRYSQRDRTQAVFFSPSKQAQRDAEQAAGKKSKQGVSWSATQALEGIVSSLSELQKEMSSWGVPEPEDGWKTWSLAFRNAKKDAAISMREEGSIGNVHATLKTCLLEAEELLHALTDVKAKQDPDETKNEDPVEGSENLDADKGAQGMWDNIEEREGWRHSVMEGMTLSATAYSAALLANVGAKLLEDLDPPKPKGKPASKGKGSKANGRPKSAETAKAPKRPEKAAQGSKDSKPKGPTGNPKSKGKAEPDKGVTRSKKGAEPAATKKSSKRKSGADPPPNVRVTRARAK